MLYIHDTRDIELSGPSVVTIGKFDGFHLGHRKLLRAACDMRRPGEQVVVFTFSRSPQMFMAGRDGAELTTHREKLNLAEAMGVDVLIEYPFTDEVRHITAEDFLEHILIGQLKACAIVAGPDCRFGYGRKGNIEFLQNRREAHGFQLKVVEKEEYHFEPISSTRIREALSKGQLEAVNDMLGYRFSYSGMVDHGRQLGRTLGFPTINQWVPEGKLVPAMGVYASLVEVDGIMMPAISNIGRKPTVSEDASVGLETFIYDFDGDLYGRELTVSLLSYRRPEHKFSSLEALKKQVDRDKEEVRSYFIRRAML